MEKRSMTARGLAELVCGIMVLVFGVLGLAELADQLDRSVSKHAIAGNDEGQTAANKSSVNKKGRAV